jgi:hypothetical protein
MILFTRWTCPSFRCSLVLFFAVSSKSICSDSGWTRLPLVRINLFLSFSVYLSKTGWFAALARLVTNFVTSLIVMSLLSCSTIRSTVSHHLYCIEVGRRLMILFKFSELSSFPIQPISFNMLVQLVSWMENLWSSTPSSGFNQKKIYKKIFTKKKLG